MKKINKLVGGFLLSTVLWSASSCRKLEEYNPSNATAEEVWSTPEGFITNVNGAYRELRGWYGKEDGMFLGESGTDLWFNAGKASYANQLTRYEGLTPAAGNPNRALWPIVYRGINVCNAGIERVGNAGFPTVAERNQREAELRFLRAFYYWHVVETWGGVVLRTRETQSAELTAMRSPVSAFYDLIISDLDFAIQNLPVQWGNSEYGRASKKAAVGLKARACLSRAYYAALGSAEANEWFTRARDAANELINNPGTYRTRLVTNYASLWSPDSNKTMVNNGESLFSVVNSTNQALNYDANSNRLHMWYLPLYSGKPGLTQSLQYGNDGQRRLMPTRALLDLYTDSLDSRYTGSFQEVWIANTNFTWTAAAATTNRKDSSVIGKALRAGIDTALVITKRRIANKSSRTYLVFDRDTVYNSNGTIRGLNEFVSLTKFRDPNRSAANAQPGFNDIFVIRFAEMYLIAAEAEFQLGNAATAAQRINVLRTRAAIKTPVDRTAAMQISAADVNISFILDERARELAGEHLRWFDLKRTNQFTTRIKALNPDITAVQDFHRLRPVPQTEIDALQNGAEFGQNAGYN